MKFFWTLNSIVLLVGITAASASPESNVRVIEGTTEAEHHAELSLILSGQIDEINVKEGQKVEKGDLILQYVRRVEKLEASRRKLIWQDKAELKFSQIQETIASSIYSDAESLYKESGAISGEEYKAKKGKYYASVAKYQQLLEVEAIEEVEYKLAFEQVKNRELRAPFSGTITRIYHSIGESVPANTPLVQLVDSRAGVFIANISADEVNRMKIGQRMSVVFDSLEGSIVKAGKVNFISPVADSASNLVRLKILFNNSDVHIKLGVPAKLE